MLTVVIQAVAQRQRERQALVAELSRQGVAAKVIEAGKDERPRQTFIRSLRAAEGDWCVRLEDDAWPAPSFGSELPGIIDSGSFSVLALYSNRKRISEASSMGKRLVRLSPGELTMAVGIVVATEIVECFATWLPSWEIDNPQHKAAYDLSLAEFCRQRRLLIQAIAPSLVQHRDTESFLGHPCGRRKSRSYMLAFGDIPPC